MYLLSRTNHSDKVEVSSILPNLNKIKEYKKSHIEQIPYDERILIARASSDDKLLVTPSDSGAYGNEYRYHHGNAHFHSIDKYSFYDDWYGKSYFELKYDERYNQIMDFYINGGYSNMFVKQLLCYYLVDKDESTYHDSMYLLITATYNRTEQFEKYMHNIIQLTKKLYLLQMLERGNFSKVVDEDIEEQLQLFDIDRLRWLDTGSIPYFDQYGALPGSYENLTKQVEIGQKILSKKFGQ